MKQIDAALNSGKDLPESVAKQKPVFDSYTQIKTAQSIDTTGVALF